VTVLCPPHGRIDHAFARAKDELAQGRRVRLVGPLATLESVWPEWARTTPGLVVTELAAARAATRFEGAAPLTQAIRTWLDTLVRDVMPTWGGQALYTSACARLFQPLIDEHPFVEGDLSWLSGQRVVGVGDWVGWEPLERKLTLLGCQIDFPRRTHAAPSAPHTLLLRIAAMGAGAIGEQLIESARSLRFVAQHGQPAPDFWAVVMPTWYRINRTLLEAVVLPALERGKTAGLLFFGDFRRGQRLEHQLTKVEGRVWGEGLGPSREALLKGPQLAASVPRSARGAAKAAWRAAGRLFRLAGRLSPETLAPNLAGHAVALATKVDGLTRFIGVDVVRVTFAEVAVEEAVERKQLHTAPVLMCSTSASPVAGISTFLQHRGVTVVEVLHGTAGEGWPGINENNATVLVVPTHADAAAVAPLNRRTVVAGMPLPKRMAPRATGPRQRRLLFISNYAHRDWSYLGGSHLLPLQDELLSLASKFRAREVPLDFRWRPHPADVPEQVAAAAQKAGLTDVSQGVRPLQEDLAWADLVVSAPTTAVYDALFAGVPVFLHLTPDLERTAVARWTHVNRQFYWASEVVDRIVETIRELEHSHRPLKLEDDALTYLFGPEHTPHSLLDALPGLSP
jgi:hypothetical protein